ncbi:MAG TPA: preprotein translocase subunit SecG [Caldimonas sp.]|jgi:preprotein translocase subunit SecG|nr:preprotein translocase subunit SecG [Caldimonas sp.]HEX2540094.1 preprotein translocase subunit SecG [Caldimonas sp.]
MNMVMNLVLALQIVTALVMIGLVLIQHGKGADMGASFGSGASGSLFGATGSANFLSRSTAVCAGVFFLCTLALAYTAHDRPRATTGSVLDRPAAGASAPLLPASGAGQIPRAAPAVPTGSGGSAPAPVAPAVPAAPVAPSASGAGAIPQK